FLFSLLPTSLISGEYDEFFEMSLVELVNVKITSTALMEVDNQLIPVQVSVINKEHIRVSGARSLDELLEIFVPSFIYLNKGNTGNSLGFRGIISDRNNKTLLLVNGKVMNHKSLQGALSERFITMLGDIERVEVIQSPQSSIYGPGAINAVINIFTKDGKDDQPLHISATQSIINKTTTIELRHSKKISDKLSYALYYGGDYAQGIDASKAPVKIGYGGDIIFKGDTLGSFTADQAHSYPANDLYAYGSHSDDLIDKIRHKAHAQIDYGNWQSWIRFTKGGEDRVPPQNMLTKKDPRETG
ncbi:MAG: TonB-dependent receptor plug domain-containing protein, partial [Fibrobacterales bacterium]